MKTALILILAGVFGPLVAGELLVSDAESARNAVLAAQPGDVIILKAGEWKDSDLRLDGVGTKEHPVTIRAERAGETIFTGASRIRLGGEYLIVSGLILNNLSGANADWLEFRIDSKRRADHCRVTDCAFMEKAGFTGGEKENRWIGIYGTDNQLDHCLISGKKNKGATVVVWLGEADTGHHRILKNAFTERPRLGKNGGETLRVGDSKTSMSKAECLVEGNVFTKCDGETECVSNKSCGNVYRGNWFVETQGTLTLRHGNDCLVEDNYFVGLGDQTGGIRVIGEGHRIIGNFLYGLEGDGFRSAICLVNGIPDSPANGYLQVKNVLIEGNTIFGCKEGILIGHNDEDEATLAPEGVRFVKNQITALEGRPAVRVERAATGIVWEGNGYSGELIGMEAVEGLDANTVVNKIAVPIAPTDVGTTWMK